MTSNIQQLWNELCTICQKKPHLLEYITHLLPKSMFEILDDKGNNIFLLACSYNVEAVKYLLNSIHCTQSVIEHINNDNKSALLIASDNSIEIVKYLLNSDKITKQFIMTHNFDDCTNNLSSPEFVESIQYIKSSPKYIDVNTFEIICNTDSDEVVCVESKEKYSMIKWLFK